MSTDETTVPPVPAAVNNKNGKLPVAAWLSSFRADDESLVINPHDGHEVWVVKPDGTTDGQVVAMPPAPDVEPFPMSVDFTGDASMPTLKKLLGHFTFAARVEGVAYRAELVIMVWVVCMFLRGLVTSKPILLLTGGIGAGKTTLARLIGRVLLGRKFKVVRTPPQRRDYPALMSQAPYVALDQVEQMPAWVLDDLATQATGGQVSMRKLWTDADVHTASLDAFVALTCATPEWITAYILDRSIPLHLLKQKVRVPDRVLDRFVDHHRAEILSECITVARLAYLRVMESEPVPAEDFRLADFAAYGSAVAEVIEGDQGKAAFMAALRAMTGERVALAEENDPLLAALIALARDDAKDKEPLQMTSGQLLHRLSLEMSDRPASWSAVANPTALGKALAALRTRAAGLVDIEVTKPQNKARYRIRLVGAGGDAAAAPQGEGGEGSLNTCSKYVEGEKKEKQSTLTTPTTLTSSAVRDCGRCGGVIDVGEPIEVDRDAGITVCSSCTTRSAS